MKCYHQFCLVHEHLTKAGSGFPVLRLFRFLCCVIWFNHFHLRHCNSLKREEGVGACCKNLAKPTVPPGWNATLHSNKGTLRIWLHQQPSYLWCCRRNINSSWLLWIVWTTLKLQNAPTVPVSAAAEPTETLGKQHVILIQAEDSRLWLFLRWKGSVCRSESSSPSSSARCVWV